MRLQRGLHRFLLWLEAAIWSGLKMELGSWEERKALCLELLRLLECRLLYLEQESAENTGETFRILHHLVRAR